MAPITDRLLHVTLRQGAVWKMPHRGLTSPLSHYMIVINHDPLSGEVILLSTVTSNIEGRKNYAVRTGNSPETIVEFGPSEYGELEYPSCVDCNSVQELDALEFERVVRSRCAQACDDLPSSILMRIVSGILASKTVSNDVKALVSPPLRPFAS